MESYMIIDRLYLAGLMCVIYYIFMRTVQCVVKVIDFNYHHVPTILVRHLERSMLFRSLFFVS